MRELHTERNQKIILDEEDYEIFKYYKWAMANGYAVRTSYQDKTIRMSREIMKRVLSRDLFSHELVDHINGNRADNRRCNLRLVDRQQNGANKRKIKKTLYSKYKGVTFHIVRNRWTSHIRHNGILYSKYHDTELEAAKHYDLRAKIFFGIYAVLNFPDGTN